MTIQPPAEAIMRIRLEDIAGGGATPSTGDVLAGLTDDQLADLYSRMERAVASRRASQPRGTPGTTRSWREQDPAWRETPESRRRELARIRRLVAIEAARARAIVDPIDAVRRSVSGALLGTDTRPTVLGVHVRGLAARGSAALSVAAAGARAVEYVGTVGSSLAELGTRAMFGGAGTGSVTGPDIGGIAQTGLAGVSGIAASARDAATDRGNLAAIGLLGQLPRDPSRSLRIGALSMYRARMSAELAEAEASRPRQGTIQAIADGAGAEIARQILASIADPSAQLAGDAVKALRSVIGQAGEDIAAAISSLMWGGR